MARYTMLVKTMCETLTGRSEPDGNYSQVIREAAPKVFDFDFPFWNPDEKEAFERNFLKHFYMREIGAETVGQFKLFLDDHFNAILPYYNKLWEANAVKFDFLDSYDYTEERNLTRTETGQENEKGSSDLVSETDATGNAQTNSNATGETTSQSSRNETLNRSDLHTHSSTPQSTLENFQDAKYLDDASKDEADQSIEGSENGQTNSSENTSTTTDTQNNARTTGNTSTINNRDHSTDMGESETYHRKGRQAAYPANMLRAYLEAQRNITMDFYNDCEVLFMLVY